MAFALALVLFDCKSEPEKGERIRSLSHSPVLGSSGRRPPARRTGFKPDQTRVHARGMPWEAAKCPQNQCPSACA